MLQITIRLSKTASDSPGLRHIYYESANIKIVHANSPPRIDMDSSQSPEYMLHMQALTSQNNMKKHEKGVLAYEANHWIIPYFLLSGADCRFHYFIAD